MGAPAGDESGETDHAVRASAFRDAATLVRRMATAREDLITSRPWRASMLGEITALRNAGAMLDMIALGYEQVVVPEARRGT